MDGSVRKIKPDHLTVQVNGGEKRTLYFTETAAFSHGLLKQIRNGELSLPATVVLERGEQSNSTEIKEEYLHLFLATFRSLVRSLCN